MVHLLKLAKLSRYENGLMLLQENGEINNLEILN